MQYRPNRQKTKLDVTLSAEGEAVRVTILDISRDGAKIAVPYPILVGTAVQLKLGKTTTKALIHWCENNRVGIRFLDRLDRETLLLIEAAGISKTRESRSYSFGK
jgi:hypothetical protein